MAPSIEITIDAADAEGIAAFWGAALGYTRLYERGRFIVLGPPGGDPRPRVIVQRVPDVSPGKGKVHLDLRVDDPVAEVDRLRGLGATVVWKVDETRAGGSRWTTMADPQGTLFCVAPARA
jgi:predicted enzyme related to lactoylglutathione lyase